MGSFSEFASEIVAIMGEFWWVFFVILAVAVSLAKWQLVKNINPENKKNREEIRDEVDKLFTIYPSDEERILGIEFGKDEVENTLKSIRGLVENLKKAKPFSIRAVEAIYLADQIENRFLLTENGVLVITAED